MAGWRSQLPWTNDEGLELSRPKITDYVHLRRENLVPHVSEDFTLIVAGDAGGHLHFLRLEEPQSKRTPCPDHGSWITFGWLRC